MKFQSWKNLLIAGLLFITNSLLIAQDTSWQSKNGDFYKISYPESWTFANDKKGLGMTFILQSPQENPEDQFMENVNLMVQDLAGYGLSLKDYIELSINQIPNYILDAKVESNEHKTDQELPYQKLVYTGRQGALVLKFMQYIWVEKEKAYILTLTCQKDSFEQYKEVGEEILKRFVLTPQ